MGGEKASKGSDNGDRTGEARSRIREDLRSKIQLLVGTGRVDYMPSRRTVESIIEQLIAEGRIPPREEWERKKARERQRKGETTPAQAPPEESE